MMGVPSASGPKKATTSGAATGTRTDTAYDQYLRNTPKPEVLKALNALAKLGPDEPSLSKRGRRVFGAGRVKKKTMVAKNPAAPPKIKGR